MAQPSQFIFKYIGSFSIEGGKLYDGSLFNGTGANILQMKTKNVSVSINGNPMFLTSFDDVTYLDTTATYVFDRDCVVASGIMTEVV